MLLLIGLKIFYSQAVLFRIKTHDSESRGQEKQAVHDNSELFTCSTAQKLADAINKPPGKPLFGFCRSSVAGTSSGTHVHGP